MLSATDSRSGSSIHVFGYNPGDEEKPGFFDAHSLMNLAMWADMQSRKDSLKKETTHAFNAAVKAKVAALDLTVIHAWFKPLHYSVSYGDMRFIQACLEELAPRLLAQIGQADIRRLSEKANPDQLRLLETFHPKESPATEVVDKKVIHQVRKLFSKAIENNLFEVVDYLCKRFSSEPILDGFLLTKHIDKLVNHAPEYVCAPDSDKSRKITALKILAFLMDATLKHIQALPEADRFSVAEQHQVRQALELLAQPDYFRDTEGYASKEEGNALEDLGPKKIGDLIVQLLPFYYKSITAYFYGGDLPIIKQALMEVVGKTLEEAENNRVQQEAFEATNYRGAPLIDGHLTAAIQSNDALADRFLEQVLMIRNFDRQKAFLDVLGDRLYHPPIYYKILAHAADNGSSDLLNYLFVTKKLGQYRSATFTFMDCFLSFNQKKALKGCIIASEDPELLKAACSLSCVLYLRDFELGQENKTVFEEVLATGNQACIDALFSFLPKLIHGYTAEEQTRHYRDAPDLSFAQKAFDAADLCRHLSSKDPIRQLTNIIQLLLAEPRVSLGETRNQIALKLLDMQFAIIQTFSRPCRGEQAEQRKHLSEQIQALYADPNLSSVDGARFSDLLSPMRAQLTSVRIPTDLGSLFARSLAFMRNVRNLLTPSSAASSGSAGASASVEAAPAASASIAVAPEASVAGKRANGAGHSHTDGGGKRPKKRR
jgi:hypothetical protein